MPTFSFTYSILPLAELSDNERQLCHKAVEAMRGSHAPYSEFNVGSAVRLANGEVVIGANQENASYPCGTCAERTALNYAKTAYPDAKVEAIAIAAISADAKTSTLPYPCGLCRQAMVEVEHLQGSPIKVLVVGMQEVALFTSASCLLPFAFNQHQSLNEE